MSGLFGIWNFNGEPVHRPALDAMAQAIAHRGGDGLAFWIKGSIGLGCHLRRVTPESNFENQPLVDEFGNVLLFDGRLDDRSDLLAALKLPAPGDEIPDAELVLGGFRRWGKRCPAHLLGEFAAVAFNSRDQKLLLARDPIGCHPLYYSTRGHSIVFASEAKAILALRAEPPEPNFDLIADSLLLNQIPYEDDGATFFSGIQRVVPGHIVSASPSSLVSERFWDFDPRAQVRHRAYHDYVLSLRELLTRAVRRRLRTRYPIAIAVSGGLDSSIVLSLAHKISLKQSPEPVLLPISYAPRSDPGSQENAFIRLMEQECGREILRLEMGLSGDLRHLYQAAWYSETPFFNDSWCAETPLLVNAADRGARVLLSGLWSDQFMFATGYLVDLCKRMAWRQVSQHLHEYPRWFVSSDASYFRRRFFRELALNLSPAMLRSMIRPFSGQSSRFHPNRLWVGETLGQRARRMRPRIKHPPYASAHARSIYQAARAKYHRLSFDADEMMAARFGLERTSPFLDREVIAFLMAIPGEIQTKDGLPRRLLRDAVRGLVPRAIRLREWRDEGTVSTQLERARFQAYRDAQPGAFECEKFGIRELPDLSDSAYMDLLGLEFWVRAFLSQDQPVGRSNVREAI